MRIKVLLMLVVTLLLHSNAWCAPPNIVFIFTDDQAVFTVSGVKQNPHAKTPHMDRIIREGANLTRSFTVTPVCSPSRASLMTSRYGSELGISDWIHPRREPDLGLSPKSVVWPRLLQQAGYRTGLIGKWHLGLPDKYHPTKFGFDYFMGSRYGGFKTKNPTFEVEGKNQVIQGLTADVIGDDAVKFIRRNKDNPFMLSVHHRAPHTAWLPVSEEDWEPYKDLNDEDVVIPNPDYPGLNVKRVKQMMRQYLASVRSVDRNVGKILGVLDELKLTENTVVIFSSDHGYNMGHNGIWHKGNGHWVLNQPPAVTNKNIPKGQRPNMYDKSILVPTFVRWPGIVKAGSEISGTVTNLDWFPTFCSIAGVKIPKNVKIRGRDIVPLLKNPMMNWPDTYYGEYSTKHQSQTHMRAIRTPKWKLIRDFKNPERDEFYDLTGDPEESINLIKSVKHQGEIKRLHGMILEQMRELNDDIVRDIQG